jgi:hypothetical protein
MAGRALGQDAHWACRIDPSNVIQPGAQLHVHQGCGVAPTDLTLPRIIEVDRGDN